MINCPECKTPLPGTDDEIAMIAAPPMTCPGCKKLIQIQLDGTAEVLKAPPPAPRAPPRPILAAELELAGEGDKTDDKPVRRRPTSVPVEKAAAPPPPPFPRQAVSHAHAELWTYLKGQRRATHVGFALAALVVLGGGTAFLAWAFRANHDIAYVADRHVVTLGPGEDYRGLHTLTRGEKVQVFGATAGFSLVRDAMGRTGYIPSVSVTSVAPPAVPGLSFADCQRAPFEATAERCDARADEQLGSCQDSCGKATDGASCARDCQQQYAACKRGCDGAVFADNPPTVATAPRRDAAAAPVLADDAPPPPRKKKGKKKSRR